MDAKKITHKIVTFSLTNDLVKKFDKKCKEKGYSKSKVIRVLIEKFLKGEKWIEYFCRGT